MVPCAPLECSDGEVSFGHVDAYADRLELFWTGKTPAHGPSDTGLKQPWPRLLPFRTPLPPWQQQQQQQQQQGEGGGEQQRLPNANAAEAASVEDGPALRARL